MKNRESLGGKIRILQFPIANSKGGITQYVLQNWKFIDKSKFQFDFATMSKSLDFADDLEKEGCKIYYISCYAEQDKERFINEFRKILIEGKYDVVHLHTKQWKSFLVEQIAKEVGVKKVIVHAHNTGIDTFDEKKREEEMKLHDQVMEELTKDIATDFWACSGEAAEWLYGSKIPQNKINIIKNTIDIEKFDYNEKIRNQKRRELGLIDKYVIGHVGRLEKVKNHEFILDIFSQIYMKYPHAILLLVGEGGYRKMIEEWISSLGIGNRVMLVGKRDDISDYLQAMDIFVFPSLFEGFGRALLEAQCSGLKCIGSTNVPKSVFITEGALQIPLRERSKWIQVLEKVAEGYDRMSQVEMMRKYGYDTSMQIRELEKMYLE